MKIKRIHDVQGAPFQNSHSKGEFPLLHVPSLHRPGLESDGRESATKDEEPSVDDSAQAQVVALFDDDLSNDEVDPNETLERWLDRIQHARRLDLRM